MKTYKQKIGLSIAALVLSISASFTYFSEQDVKINYPDIIAITVPFEKAEIKNTADFLTDKKINNYSGNIPKDIQDYLDSIDVNFSDKERGIVTAKVDADSVEMLSEMIKNEQLTLNDLYEDISPIFGEAVKNNEINWKWDGYAMEYTFFVAEGDELFWDAYFSHPSQTMFFHEVFSEVKFRNKHNIINIKNNNKNKKVSIEKLHSSAENFEKNTSYKDLNKTEKFNYLSQKTTNFYRKKIINIFENKKSENFEENNLELNISSPAMRANMNTNINLKHDYNADKKSLTVNLNTKGFGEDIEGEINVTKIKNDIYGILNKYEYKGSPFSQRIGMNGVEEVNVNKSLENIKNQWVQLNNPEISEIIGLLLNDKIQADVLNIAKDVAILAKDLLVTTDIFIMNEYLGKNSATGFEEFSVKLNEKYISLVPILLGDFIEDKIEIENIQKYLTKFSFIISFDKNNSENFEIELVDVLTEYKNPKLKISYTKSGLDLYSRNFNYDDNDVYHFHLDVNNFFVEYSEKNKSDKIVDIKISENNISGFWKNDIGNENNIANFNFEKTGEFWSGEITSDIEELKTGKILIENFRFDKNLFSGILKFLQNEFEMGEFKITYETSYPENIEIIDPSENKKNIIKSFANFIEDFTKVLEAEAEPIIINTEENINTNTKNYTGSLYKGNYIWGGAMNLAWTDLSKNIIKEKIDLVLDSSETDAKKLLEKLNNPVMTKSDLSEKNYYIKSGYGQKTVDQINKETKEKFPTKSFKDLDLNLSATDIIAYAYFLKEIEYKIPFNISQYEFYFKNSKNNNEKGVKGVKSFYAKTNAQKENIQILHYENDEKFIVSLLLKNRVDNLIFAKGYDMKNPEEVVKEIQKIYKNLEKNTDKKIETLQEEDSFQMPFLHVDMTREYTELINKYLKNSKFTQYFIAKMFENIKFDINEKGARVENEAVITMEKNSVMPYFENQYTPKNIILDDDFWVIMKQANSLNPYFILGVQNNELMKEFEENSK